MRVFSLVRQQRCPNWAWVPAAIGAAGTIASTLLGRSKTPSIEETTEAQKELFDYKFTKELEAMNSAHQREVADLRSAGLNPILSATGGSGLSSPSGAMPDISSVNSASVASRQADRALRTNAFLSLLDAGIRAEGNRVNDKSADASMLSAEAAADQAKAALVNSEQNAINTGSMVQERLFKMGNLDADTKKKLAEINLVNSQMYLNSAYASKANTDAYVASQMLPYDQALKDAEAKYKTGILPADIRARSVSGGYQGLITEEIKGAENWIKEKRDQGLNSAKDAWDLPTHGMSSFFTPYKFYRKFMNNK